MAQIRKPKSVTARSVTKSKPFRLGFEDYRAGLGFRDEYDRWSVNEQLNYERGRMVAACFPSLDYARQTFKNWRGNTCSRVHPDMDRALVHLIRSGGMTG